MECSTYMRVKFINYTVAINRNAIESKGCETSGSNP